MQKKSVSGLFSSVGGISVAVGRRRAPDGRKRYRLFFKSTRWPRQSTVCTTVSTVYFHKVLVASPFVS